MVFRQLSYSIIMLVWVCFLGIIVTARGFDLLRKGTPNVCRKNIDYITRLVNEDCWYDPDVDASLEEIINNHGLSVKNYTTTTNDGYSLTIFRITGTLDNPKSLEKAQPLFLQHGIFRDARCWLLRGELSPAIYYAKKGYQVWIGNARGTAFSSHKIYSRNEKEFWDFTFHEIGTQDIPTMIDKIAEVTVQSGNIIYVGHSMGTSVSYVYGSENSTHCNKNLKAIISLAPIAFLNKVPIPFIKFLSDISGPLKDTLYLLHNYDFNITFLARSCLLDIEVCKLGLQVICGVSKPNIYDEIFPILVTHGDTPFSVKMARHYGQIISSHGKFRQYDYGGNNEKVYGSSEPPSYNVSAITRDVHLIYANNDVIATEPDTKVLFSKLECTKTLTKVPSDNEKLGHLDFIIAKEMEKEIFTPVSKILEQYK